MNYYYSMMGGYYNMMGGYYGGPYAFLCWLLSLAILALVVLGIIALWKYITKK